jgi:RimJ/RimL family protein N-acetyltransferase
MDAGDPVIETERLRLRTLSPDFLRASLGGERERAQALLGAALPAAWPREPDVLRMRLAQIEEHPHWEPWLTRAIEWRDEGCVVGIGGFHGPPGGEWLAAFAPGGVEFGYTVYEGWRRRGIAFEAAHALIAWAERASAAPSFVLSIAPRNCASIRLARKLGFARVGRWHHAQRGEEHVYRRAGGALEGAA